MAPEKRQKQYKLMCKSQEFQENVNETTKSERELVNKDTIKSTY